MIPQGEPTVVCITELCPLGRVRDNIRRWQVDVADEGFMTPRYLCHPVHAICELPLCDRKCPMLMILWELERLGWKAVPRPVLHDALSVVPGTYDARRILSDRYYYRCLLDWPRVSCVVGGGMPSNQILTYYEVLLSGVPAVPKQSKKCYTIASRMYRRSLPACRNVRNA